MTQWSQGSVAGVHTMSRTDLPRTRTSPHDVRRKNFSVRLRGVDPGEVRSFLTGLADELEGIQTQVAVLTQENQALRAQLDETRAEVADARADPMEHATDQAVSVLNQAQQLADSLIDEAMQSARDLLLTARSQQRDIMEQAKVAQVKFQAVLDALNEQVSKLGEVGGVEPLRADTRAADSA